jgi:hypothetical protein
MQWPKPAPERRVSGVDLDNVREMRTIIRHIIPSRSEIRPQMTWRRLVGSRSWGLSVSDLSMAGASPSACSRCRATFCAFSKGHFIRRFTDWSSADGSSPAEGFPKTTGMRNVSLGLLGFLDDSFRRRSVYLPAYTSQKYTSIKNNV